MYLGIDIGGTKTLVAAFTNSGSISEQVKFPTPVSYPEFLRQLAKIVASLTSKSDYIACCVAAPGRIEREKGVLVACGNLPWRNVPLKHDVRKITKCPIVLENDANLAGLSEAILRQKNYDKVLYVTVSTGIGTGIITDQTIDPDFADAEGGRILLEHQGKLQMWESFASGSAIVRRYGKRAHDIHDPKIWKRIASDLAVGLIDLCAIIQPEVIVIGGGVGNYFSQFSGHLKTAITQYETPLTPVPPIQQAARAEEAVIYGCFELAKSTYGRVRRRASASISAN